LLNLAGEQNEEVDRAQKFLDALNACGGNLHFMAEWIQSSDG